MKKMISLLAAVLLLTTASIAQGAPEPIEGAWGMQMNQNGFVMDMTFTIGNGALTLQNVCTYMGRSATVRVTAPASWDSRTLTVHGHASGSESQNGVDCNASLRPDRMNYVVNGNTLTLSHDGSPESFTLVRK